MIRSRFAAALAGAAVVVTTAVALGAAPSSNSPAQLLIVPSTPHARDVLAGTSARVIARYGAFTLVQAQGEDADSLKRAGAERRDDLQRVTLNGRSIDPSGRSSLAGKGRVGRSGLALVQFVGPVKDAWLDNVRGTGVKVVTYMPEDSYLVHGSASSLERLSDLLGSDPAVRAVTSLARSDKLGRGLRSSGRQTVAVQTVAGSAGTAARRAVKRAGTQLRQGPAISGTVSQVVIADAAKLSALASDPAVVAVQPYKSPKLMDERAAKIMAGSVMANGLLTGTPDYLSFVDGRVPGPFGFRIDVTDEGLDTGTVPTASDGSHPDFYVDGDPTKATRIQYEKNWTVEDLSALDCGGHGTNVASIAAGFNNKTIDPSGDKNGDAQGYRYGLGIAPRIELGASKIFTCPFSHGPGLEPRPEFQLDGTFADLTNHAFANGARISNNSWGSDLNGGYDVDAQQYDALVRDPGMTEVFAAGNAGPGSASVSSPGTAKNVITVGASESIRTGDLPRDVCDVADSGADNARDIIDFSGRGPTADGRIKPDLVAPGTHVTGASPQHARYDGTGTCIPDFPADNQFYSLVSGTSQATPEVTGAAALVRQWYHDTSSAGSGSFPSPAMTKAILINSASDVAGGQDGDGGTELNVPTNDQGWGRANLDASLSSTNRIFDDQGHTFTATGDQQQETIQRQDATKQMKITLVWTDAVPGSVAGNPWVNDLDLVVDAGGKTYHGNVFAGGASVPGGAADSRNNVENVYLPTSISGPVRVSVVAKNIAGDGVPGGSSTDQDYALVISNGAVVPAAAQASAAGTTVHEQGDGDGAIEPGEAFTLNQVIGNPGDAALPGGTGTLTSASPGLSLSTASSPYDPIAPGATEMNSTPFAGSLASSASCGAPLDLSLSLSGNAVPLNIPTGATGPTLPRDSSDVPKSIPDGVSTGVASVLDIPTHGIVRDLDVRIASITHTWDGDLKLQLTSPQGTTVVLANRPAGLDNSGDNLNNTTFDDQATRNISSGASPFTGRFRPQGDQLARFDGEDRFGTWTLRVIDRAKPDPGVLRGWGLDFRSAICRSGPDQPPVAGFGIDRQAVAGQPFVLDSGVSHDPDGEITFRDWDLDGNGQFDDATGPVATYQFATPGPHDVGLRVADDNDAVAEIVQTISVAAPPNPPPPPPKDTTPPKLSLGRAVSKIASAIKKGVSMRMGCSEACTITAELDLDKRTAKKLHVAASTVRIARARTKLTKAGTKTVTLKLTRKARKGFAHQRSVKLKLVVTAVDTAGNRTVVRRTLTLRR
ncbi:MAG: S8 family serine peptidase [Thermoleophilaceae bacterium]